MSGSLLDRTMIAEQLTCDAPWHESHGAKGDYLGMGLLYYALTYAARARIAVCLGSGGGFVPRLMRQAQRDLEIGDESRTILVDGDVPEAGWGQPFWLGEDSFFRRHYPDVEIVLQSTRDAAQMFFQPKGIRIGYLHIDADHSFQGCLEDFLRYRPFLDSGSLVTFHDTNFPGAGVTHVVDRLRTRSDCEVVDFVDTGAGTALVRITSDEPAAHARRVAADRKAAVRVVRKPDVPELDPPLVEWRYLRSTAFSVRNVLAAHFVRDCPMVVEIGGWHTPIDRYLTGPHNSVLVVDPFIRESTSDELNGEPCAVRHIRARFQDLRWRIVRPRDYGLVILGYDLEGLSALDENVLFDLIENARTTVIEFPTSWESSRDQYARVRARAHVAEVVHTGLDLGGNDFGDLTNSWPPRVDRELHVLVPVDDPLRSQQRDACSFAERPAGTEARSLRRDWERLLGGEPASRAVWHEHGGSWSIGTRGVRVTSDGEEWVAFERELALPTLADDKNLVVEVAVAGTGEAAGISFGAYRDFLVPPRESPQRVRVEIDRRRGTWIQRANGRIYPPTWWNEGATSVDDLLTGRLTLKARHPADVTFSDISLREVEMGCQISVVLTCNRFLQRLRLALRNWCHQDVPAGALEILVVNPESPDGTADHLAVLARESRHVSVQEVRVPATLATNKGAMINRALELAQGEWIWITDADCLFPPGAAHEALRQAQGAAKHLYYLRRRHLADPQTDALLAGTLDSVHDFGEIAGTPGSRADDEAPWGYSQFISRAALARVRYREDTNHFAHTDEQFAAACARDGYRPKILAGLVCLHLSHPYAWNGTDAFL